MNVEEIYVHVLSENVETPLREGRICCRIGGVGKRSVGENARTKANFTVSWMSAHCFNPLLILWSEQMDDFNLTTP